MDSNKTKSFLLGVGLGVTVTVLIVIITFVITSTSNKNGGRSQLSSNTNVSAKESKETQFVNEFVFNYTNYNNLNDRNKAVKGYVTDSVSKEFGFNEKAPDDVTLSMESKSIKIWHGKAESNEYLAMVKDSLNGDEKTDLIDIHVTKKNNKLVIDKLTLPISSADSSKYGN